MLCIKLGEYYSESTVFFNVFMFKFIISVLTYSRCRVCLRILSYVLILICLFSRAIKLGQACVPLKSIYFQCTHTHTHTHTHTFVSFLPGQNKHLQRYIYKLIFINTIFKVYIFKLAMSQASRGRNTIRINLTSHIDIFLALVTEQ